MSDLIRKANSVVSIFDVLGQSHLKGSTPVQVHCPMHSDKHKSARIYPATNSIHCFAESKSWDPVAVVADQEGVSMFEAAKMITEEVGVRWQRTKGSEFGKLVAKYKGRMSEADVKVMRLEIHDQALWLRDQGAVVDWDGFDNAHMDVDKLKAWVAELRDSVYMVGVRKESV